VGSPDKCTSVVVVKTFEDGHTTAITYANPESVESEVDLIDTKGEYTANALYAFDARKQILTLTVTTGERGVVTVVTPVPGA
jgi:hypothetical protein